MSGLVLTILLFFWAMIARHISTQPPFLRRSMDAIAVMLPHDLHAEYACKVLAAGMYVRVKEEKKSRSSAKR